MAHYEVYKKTCVCTCGWRLRLPCSFCVHACFVRRNGVVLEGVEGWHWSEVNRYSVHLLQPDYNEASSLISLIAGGAYDS